MRRLVKDTLLLCYESVCQLGHLHDLLNPIHINRHTDEDAWLAGVSAAPHWYDDSLQDPTIAVLTGQRAAVVSLKERKRRTLQCTCTSYSFHNPHFTSIAKAELITHAAAQMHTKETSEALDASLLNTDTHFE